MEPKKIRAVHGPEYHVQNLFIPYLEGRGWLVERFIGNAFQYGIPDLMLFNKHWGYRWVDIKVHGRYNFTKPQRIKWPEWEAAGLGIWILGARSKEACTIAHMAEEHKLLFQPPNMRAFWKPSWDIKPDIDEMLEGLDASKKDDERG